MSSGIFHKCLHFALFCIINLIIITSCENTDDKKPDKNVNASTNQVDEIQVYKNLFKVKRKEHIIAIQKLLLVEDVAKQARLIEIMMDAIIKTVSEAALNLEINGYAADGNFPTDSSIKDDLSKILENTALFTDIIVRFPKPSRIFYKKNKQKWIKVMKNAIEICAQSGIYDGDYEVLLHNLKQELGIGPIDENYKNPFLSQTREEDFLSSEEKEKLYKAAKRKKKMMDKKSKRSGPKLSMRSDL